MILRDKIYNTIRDRIISGQYGPGEILSEKEIISELGTSRTPFREAINALNEDGLVTVYPHRGIFVRELSLKDVADGFDIRFQLEPYAVQLACCRMPLARIEELIGRAERLDRNDYGAMLAEDSYFHDTLISYVDNAQLTKIMKNLYDYNQFQVTLFDDISMSYVSEDRRTAAINSIEEHLDVLRCLKNRDQNGAAEKMRYHLEQARKRTIR